MKGSLGECDNLNFVRIRFLSTLLCSVRCLGCKILQNC